MNDQYLNEKEDYMKDWKGMEIPSEGWIYEYCYPMSRVSENRLNACLDYEMCQVCGNKRVRYIHLLYYPDDPHEPLVIVVDRACAEKMTGDHVNPGKNERDILKKEMKDPDWLLHECLSSMEGE